MATAVAPAPDGPVRTGPGAVHRGPPLGQLAIVFTGLFLASLVIIGTMTGGAAFPTPNDPPEAVRAFFGPNADVLRVAFFLQFGAAIPLGIFTATAVSRLRFLGLNVAGVTIAQFGGFTASTMLALSGLISWTMTQPGIVDDPGALRALQLLTFATGGAGHVVPLGLLLAGIAVPAGFARLMPRWLVWSGIVVAVVAELSSLSLIFPAVSPLLPLARFPALLWLIGAGFTLPTSRGAARSA